MIRFLHSGDWQLGMTRHFLAGEAQARFAQARFDAIRAIGRVAGEQGCAFVVACGDVFESNQVDRRTVARALEALAAVPVPVYLLPGNHDPLDAASVLLSPVFAARRPHHVHVLTAEPVAVAPGVELVGVPWTSKRPDRDLVGAAVDSLAPFTSGVRIVAGHGIVDALSPDRDDPARIRLAGVEAGFADGRLHYLALGDRHSVTAVGATGRAWYSGAPEPTDFDEVDPGKVLVVDLAPGHVDVRPIETGTWTFLREVIEVAGDADLDLLEGRLGNLSDKERTVVRLVLRGTLDLSQAARLQDILDRAGDALAALDVSRRSSDYHVVPADADFADLGLSGFAAEALAHLRELAVGEAASAVAARDALGLLVRLGRRPA